MIISQVAGYHTISTKELKPKWSHVNSQLEVVLFDGTILVDIYIVTITKNSVLETCSTTYKQLKYAIHVTTRHVSQTKEGVEDVVELVLAEFRNHLKNR